MVLALTCSASEERMLRAEERDSVYSLDREGKINSEVRQVDACLWSWRRWCAASRRQNSRVRIQSRLRT